MEKELTVNLPIIIERQRSAGSGDKTRSFEELNELWATLFFTLERAFNEDSRVEGLNLKVRYAIRSGSKDRAIRLKKRRR